MLSCLALALDPSRDITQYNCRTWTRQNGLPVNGINALAQTPDGYLWLGTAGGLVRFDGRNFDSIELSRVGQVRNTIVKSLAVAQNGGLWAGLENSAFGFYNGKVFSFQGREEWGGVGMNVRTILQGRDGGLWFATPTVASRLTPMGNFESVMALSAERSLDIVCAFEDAQGRVWFSTAGDELYYWQSGKMNKFAYSGIGMVRAIAQDRNGLIWFGGEGGLRCYDSNLKLQEIAPYKDYIGALYPDRQGTLWFGTDLQGVGMYRNGHYSFLGKIGGLAGESVSALVEDKEGSLWVGTEAGLSQLTDVKFPTLQPIDAAAADYAAAVSGSRQGGIWIATRSGATYFDGKAKLYSTEAGLPPGPVKRVFEARNGDLYLVTGMTNLVILSGEKVVAVHKAPDLVVGLTEDAQGVIVSIAGELYRANRDALTPYLFNGDKPDFRWILNLAMTKDGALLVACEAGIFRIKDGVVQNWTSADGLSDQRVQGICEDQDGVVWAWLFTGIARLKDNRICSIGLKEGLFDGNIYAIVPDNFGNLWVDSGKGIFRVTRKAMNDFADGKTTRVECVAYDTAESVNTADKGRTQERVGCSSRDGRIWFPSAKGVIMIDPSNILMNPVPPPVHLDRVMANGAPFSASQKIAPAGEGELEFHFTALTYIAPQKARYRYRLKGFDHDWVEAGNRQIAFYTNLKPGNYYFQVTAANADGIWNRAGDSIDVELPPRYYQTLGFRLICGGAAALGVLGLFLWRAYYNNIKQRALREARERLECEVQNRTAELATVNTSLQREVEDRKSTEVELVKRTEALEKEIAERIQMQREVERVHRALLDTSRRAGMAEIATNVLHNVGNVLNSVNVSSALALEGLQKSSISGLPRVLALLEEHRGDLASFIANDPRGQKLLIYLGQLSERLLRERDDGLRELESMRQNVEHIKEIVVMQQSYATVSGVKEVINLRDSIEDSLKIYYSAADSRGVELVRDLQDVPPIVADKHKILQILVNLLSNAKHACLESGRADQRILVRLLLENKRIKIVVVDNGVGIGRENLDRIFNHGFTTRKEGHGFGLHSGAIAAKEMGGSLSVQSPGLGSGATFTFELLCSPAEGELPSPRGGKDVIPLPLAPQPVAGARAVSAEV